MTLELSYSNEPIDNRLWIDPEVVGLLEITDDELSGYRQTSDYQDEGGTVAQPGTDAPGPHMNYPAEAYEFILNRTDEEVLNSVDSQPPVKLVNEAS
jgi:hypothetical protein